MANPPPLLDTIPFFKENLNDGELWPISVANIKVIQDAYVSYMEHGLSLEHVSQHLDNSEYGMPDDAILECVLAYSAASISIPHPRISELLTYVREATRNFDEGLFRNLRRLFDYNPMRKYAVIAALDHDKVGYLTTVSPIGVEDCILAYLMGDKDAAHKIVREASTGDREKALDSVRHYSARPFGYMRENPEYLGHREVIAKVAVQIKAMAGIKDLFLYDRDLLLKQPKPPLEDRWSLETTKSTALDHGVLDLDETIRTIREVPQAFIEGIRAALDADTTQNVPLIDKLVIACEKGGLSRSEIFHALCRKLSHVEFLDQEACAPTLKDHLIRLMLRSLRNFNTKSRRQIAEHLIKSEPLDVIIEACEFDRELQTAYDLLRDKRLLLKMSSAGRDQAFGSDIGL